MNRCLGPNRPFNSLFSTLRELFSFPSLSSTEEKLFYKYATVSNFRMLQYLSGLTVLISFTLFSSILLLTFKGTVGNFPEVTSLSRLHAILFLPPSLLVLLFVRVPREEEVTRKNRLVFFCLYTVFVVGALIFSVLYGDSTMYNMIMGLVFLGLREDPRFSLSVIWFNALVYSALLLFKGDFFIKHDYQIVEVLLGALLYSWIFLLRQKYLITQFQKERTIRKQNLELSRMIRLMKNLAMLDPLTQIPNRRSFDINIADEWQRARRSKLQLGLLMIDIDHFKNYNDTFGHQQGDECLKQVACALQNINRRVGDLAARYGGEEFAVILSDVKSGGVQVVAERLRAAVSELNIEHPDVSEGHVTVSVGGTSLIPDGNSSPERLVKAADDALYLAKKNGRNRVELAENLPSCAAAAQSS